MPLAPLEAKRFAAVTVVFLTVKRGEEYHRAGEHLVRMTPAPVPPCMTFVLWKQLPQAWHLLL